MAELYFFPSSGTRRAHQKRRLFLCSSGARARRGPDQEKKCNLFWVNFFWEGFPLRKYPFSYDLASVDFDCIVKLELLVDS